MVIREPALDGLFYPSQKQQLRRTIDELFVATTAAAEGARAVLSPCASLEHCGAVAAAAYRALVGPPPTLVVIIGDVPRAGLVGCAIPESEAWRSPLGLSEVVIPGRGLPIPDWFDYRRCEHREDVHLNDHSVEVQLPFVHYLWPNVPLLPIALGPQADVDHLKRYIGFLDGALARVVVVASANCSGPTDQQRARQQAGRTIDAVTRPTDATTVQLSPALRTLQSLAASCNATVLARGSSFSTDRDPTGVTEYCAVGFYRRR